MPHTPAKQIPPQNTMQEKVLIDASSAILLYKAELFEDLLRYYSIIVSETVFKEITKAGYPGADHFAACGRQKKLRIKKIDPEEKIKSLPSLHQGEQETVALFLQGFGKFIITDDGPAARLCKSQSIPFINALLVPRILFVNHILSVKESLKKMETLVMLGRYSEKIIDFARNCPAQDLRFFRPDK